MTLPPVVRSGWHDIAAACGRPVTAPGTSGTLVAAGTPRSLRFGLRSAPDTCARGPTAPKLGEKVTCASRRITPRAKAAQERPTTAPSDGVLRPTTAPSEGVLAKVKAPFPPYAWQPVQATHLGEQFEDVPASQYFRGTFVNTLSVELATVAGDAEDTRHLQLGPTVQSEGGLSCHVVGGNLVACRGLAMLARGGNLDEGIFVARLPSELAVGRSSLVVAAALRAPDSGATTLVALVVRPDGWIVCTGVPDWPYALLDLSAVRFCIGPGLILKDNAKLFTCDLPGRRYIVLQGHLNDPLPFDARATKPLLAVPNGCAPARVIPFIVAGQRSRSFHLLYAEPSGLRGLSASLRRIDSILYRDRVHLTGIIFEASAAARQREVVQKTWFPEASRKFLEDFRRRLTDRCGSAEAAWHRHFDKDGSGGISFEEFNLGCKAVGYVWNTERLWSLLDDDRSGEISFEELAGDPQASGSGALAGDSDAQQERVS
eukprot:TRINITY_DN5709_c3_g1_i1.p1 TRINITY_DN5709_c3_g1~~TRINITY_DN5709_c3_g1_i1.p1  ORF type:complete len:487 (-),score=92.06 TRINITY_DN5709_c3_g1_i1:54-1514(-)